MSTGSRTFVCAAGRGLMIACGLAVTALAFHDAFAAESGLKLPPVSIAPTPDAPPKDGLRAEPRGGFYLIDARVIDQINALIDMQQREIARLREEKTAKDCPRDDHF